MSESKSSGHGNPLGFWGGLGLLLVHHKLSGTPSLNVTWGEIAAITLTPLWIILGLILILAIGATLAYGSSWIIGLYCKLRGPVKKDES